MMDSKASLAIALEDVHFHGYHGVMAQERTVGNEFAVDLHVTVALPSAADGLEAVMRDDIGATVSYADLYECVEKQMRRPSALIEHVAAQIVDEVASRWASVETVEVRIKKVAPPISGCDGAAAVTLRWKR